MYNSNILLKPHVRSPMKMMYVVYKMARSTALVWTRARKSCDIYSPITDALLYFWGGDVVVVWTQRHKSDFRLLFLHRNNSRGPEFFAADYKNILVLAVPAEDLSTFHVHSWQKLRLVIEPLVFQSWPVSPSANHREKPANGKHTMMMKTLQLWSKRTFGSPGSGRGGSLKCWLNSCGTAEILFPDPRPLREPSVPQRRPRLWRKGWKATWFIHVRRVCCDSDGKT